MADTANTNLVERIARVLCAAEHSKNAEGSEPSAGEHVNQHWPKHRNQALAVLHAIREADDAAASAGDAEVWQRMVEASIKQAE
ncbi:hypothetical protein ACFQPG_07185 [Sphingomonas sp. GCM10030256]|uniref:hypothetical protein n=1 Tax=Sphingomonas sp. GCM10030256 TaxID=3273427 RepID=UPI00360907A1